MTSQDGFSSSFVETVAGFTAGVVSTLTLHPLDMVKTRLQGKLWYFVELFLGYRVTNSGLVYAVDRSSSRLGGSLRIIRKIFYNEGGSAAFYRGLTPNLIGNSTSWGLYFLCYSSLKDSIRIYHKERGQILTSSDYLLASGSAGIHISCPIQHFSSVPQLTCGFP